MCELPTRTTPLQPPTEFPFPFPPYDIQKDMMRELYLCFEHGGLGVFQSPTGTGKSMTTLCSALQWLRDDLKQTEKDALASECLSNSTKSNSSSKFSCICPSPTSSKPFEASQSPIHQVLPDASSVPSWVVKHHKERRVTEAALVVERWRAKMSERLERLQRLRDRIHTGEPIVKRKYITKHVSEMLSKTSSEDCDTDDDLIPCEYTSEDDSLETGSDDEADGDTQHPRTRKVFFCSRTHSQLKQFINEVKASPFHDVRLIVLGSRLNLCTNPLVRKLNGIDEINEKCLDLQKEATTITEKTGKSKHVSKCPMLQQQPMSLASDILLSSPQDIEEVVITGSTIGACTYYASRQAADSAEIVLVPYNMLLHKPTRNALGLDLKDNIVIIDEIGHAYVALRQYADKFKVPLFQLPSPLYGMLTGHFLMSLQQSGTINRSQKLVVSNKMTPCLGQDERYCERSELHRKLLGFTQRLCSEVTTSCTTNTKDFALSKHISPLRVIQSFFEALTHSEQDGRIIIKRGTRSSSLCFMLLNPAVYFEEVIVQARAVAVLGGTMGPIDDFVDQLRTPKTAEIQVRTFSCNHVVDSSNIIALGMIDDLGRFLVNTCRIVPGGIVVFFTSYEMEKLVFERWLSIGTIQRFEKFKVVVRESKGAGSLETCLTTHTTAVEEGRGSILFAVVGGKLSEGINFKDALGRCIVMVGLPYPNRRSVVLQEKMAFLNKRASHLAQTIDNSKKPKLPSPGERYYETLCMKAVNQSIGRAIRHRHDYAAIILADERYTQPNIVAQLPEWIRSYFQPTLKACGLIDFP
eukprot:gene2574-5491_t